jgi:ADP-ribosylglycohydrolase
MEAAITLRDRYRGSLLGLAAGDALGTTLEFKSPGSFEPIDDMVGGGPFGLRPGEWTDDTSMALCLAESLVESGSWIGGATDGSRARAPVSTSASRHGPGSLSSSGLGRRRRLIRTRKRQATAA